MLLFYNFITILLLSSSSGHEQQNRGVRPQIHQMHTVISNKDASVKSKVLAVIYTSLIPLIIVANLLLIFGIIKTRQNKLNSSLVLFSTLFESDLTFDFV